MEKRKYIDGIYLVNPVILNLIFQCDICKKDEVKVVICFVQANSV